MGNIFSAHFTLKLTPQFGHFHAQVACNYSNCKKKSKHKPRDGSGGGTVVRLNPLSPAVNFMPSEFNSCLAQVPAGACTIRIQDGQCRFLSNSGAQG